MGEVEAADGAATHVPVVVDAAAAADVAMAPAPPSNTSSSFGVRSIFVSNGLPQPHTGETATAKAIVSNAAIKKTKHANPNPPE